MSGSAVGMRWKGLGERCVDGRELHLKGESEIMKIYIREENVEIPEINYPGFQRHLCNCFVFFKQKITIPRFKSMDIVCLTTIYLKRDYPLVLIERS